MFLCRGEWAAFTLIGRSGWFLISRCLEWADRTHVGGSRWSDMKLGELRKAAVINIEERAGLKTTVCSGVTFNK